MKTLTKITNIKELDEEIVRMKLRTMQQENLLKVQIQGLKESLKPGHLIKDAIFGNSEDKKESGFLKKGLGYGFSFILENIVLRKSPFLVKTLGTSLIHLAGPNVSMSKIQDYFTNIFKKKKEHAAENGKN